MKFVAKYRVRIKGALAPTPWFWVRNEQDPNERSWATRFSTQLLADEALNEIRNNLVAMRYTGFQAVVEPV